MPYHLIIQGTDFQKLIKQLQIAEEKHQLSQIEGLLPSQFLFFATQPNYDSESVTNKAKTILLHLAGDYHTPAAQLSERLDLKTHLLFKETHYNLLYLKLHNLLQHYQPEKKISIKEIKDCQSVADCLALLGENN